MLFLSFYYLFIFNLLIHVKGQLLENFVGYFTWNLCGGEGEVDNLAHCFLSSFDFVIYIEFRRYDFKGLLFIPYATLFTVVKGWGWGLKKKKIRQFCTAENKVSVYTGVADYPTILSTFKYCCLWNCSLKYKTNYL